MNAWQDGMTLGAAIIVLLVVLVFCRHELGGKDDD